MSGLKHRVLALIGRRRKGPGVSGWVRVDVDHVVRGWAVDAADPGRRVKVDVRLDGEVIAQATADRFDPKLVELGQGDGRHAFEVLIPRRFRDGRPHAFQAVEPGSGYRLMQKTDSFKAPRSADPPRLQIDGVDEDLGVTGTLRGGQYPPQVQLELWSGGERLPVGETSWRWRGGVAEFRLDWPERTLCALAADAAVAGPGMHEAGEAAPFASALRLHPELGAEGFTVALQGRLRLASGSAPLAEVVDAAGAVLASAPLVDGTAVLPSSAALFGTTRLRLRGANGIIPLFERSAPVRVGPLLRNGGFAVWSGQAPADWSLGPGVTAAPGVYAFPEEASFAATGGGDIVRLRPGDGPLLLTQGLAVDAPTAGPNLDLRLVARCSEPASLVLALVGEGDEVCHSLTVRLEQAWAWTAAGQAVQLDGRRIGRVEVRLDGNVAADAEVELAAVTVGGDPARDARSERAWGLPENLVDNGDFADWPRGLLIEVGSGRAESAGGWFVQNRKAGAPVRVMASTASGRIGMAVAADRVVDYCRLEARLHPETLRAGPRLRVSFEAESPLNTPAAFQSRQSHTVIERVFLLRRGVKAAAAGTVLSAEVLALVARRVAVGRETQTFRFEVDLDASNSSELDSAELFLAFDFNDPFAILLRQVEVGPAPAAEAAGPGLELEDPAITAQASTLKGLGGWLSADVVSPGVRFEPSPAAGARPLRWSPAPQGAATVEVVICVHDAAEETLACLRSLVTGSTLPHTVRIIDDASGDDTRNRLLDFICDKPWIRMISNAENRGYTASANIGVRGSAADWVILLNSDTVVTPGWIEGLLECAASDPAIAFIGPVSNAASYQSVPELKDRQGRWKVNVLPPGWSPERMAAFVAAQADKGFPQVPLLNGFCTLIRRDAFVALGGFNEAAFPQGYGEENDLCLRAEAAGYRLAVADHVYVYHAKSASFGSARRTQLQKAAGKALAELHPDADFTALGDRVREAAALVNLRGKVRALQEAQG